MGLKRLGDPLTPAEREVMDRAYDGVHFSDPRTPTLAEAREVIEALLLDAHMCDGHCGSAKGAGCSPADARAFLARVRSST